MRRSMPQSADSVRIEPHRIESLLERLERAVQDPLVQLLRAQEFRGDLALKIDAATRHPVVVDTDHRDA